MERILLLVDDEENITSALNRLLRRDGYTILRANSGLDGLAMLEQYRVGVIISDQRMPVMTGTEFLSKVRERYPDTVRIVLSGYTELNSVTDAINRGAVYKFLTKPWEDDLLRSHVEEAFQRYEMKRENARLAQELTLANDELRTINQNLEQRVREKTREVSRNLNVLQISQEILEQLPVAVIGLDEGGMIAVANQMAHQLFSAGGTRSLLGEFANTIIPTEFLCCATEGKYAGHKTLLRVGEQQFNCWCSPMGRHSQSKGVVLVIDHELHADQIRSSEVNP